MNEPADSTRAPQASTRRASSRSDVVLVSDVECLRAGRIETGAGRDQNLGQRREHGIAGLDVVAVPRRITHLRPLVGTHDDNVVTACDIGDKLIVGYLHPHPWTSFCG